MPEVGHILKDELSVLRSTAACGEISKCPGCWYCFRGEADVSFSINGCLEKVIKHGRIFLHNAKQKNGCL
jgi:hypothetical protein